jgi:hypothetical protein
MYRQARCPAGGCHLGVIGVSDVFFTISASAMLMLLSRRRVEEATMDEEEGVVGIMKDRPCRGS